LAVLAGRHRACQSGGYVPLQHVEHGFDAGDPSLGYAHGIESAKWRSDVGQCACRDSWLEGQEREFRHQSDAETGGDQAEGCGDVIDLVADVGLKACACALLFEVASMLAGGTAARGGDPAFGSQVLEA
jgi:hypothetical protein